MIQRATFPAIEAASAAAIATTANAVTAVAASLPATAMSGVFTPACGSTTSSQVRVVAPKAAAASSTVPNTTVDLRCQRGAAWTVLALTSGFPAC